GRAGHIQRRRVVWGEGQAGGRGAARPPLQQRGGRVEPRSRAAARLGAGGCACAAATLGWNGLLARGGANEDEVAFRSQASPSPEDSGGRGSFWSPSRDRAQDGAGAHVLMERLARH